MKVLYMTPIFPIIELIDRLAIAEIKRDRGVENSLELGWYTDQMKSYDIKSIQEDFIELKNIHNSIWDLESDLKSGFENRHSLEELGLRAIEIRNLNNKRIKLKNNIAEKLNCKVREIKKEHLSQ